MQAERRPVEAGERREARNLVEEAQQVAPELGGAVPVLKAKRRLPQAPERAFEQVPRKHVLHPLGADLALGHRHQAQDFGPVARRQAQPRGVEDLVVAIDEAGPGVQRMRVVKADDRVAHAQAAVVECWNGREQIPQRAARPLREPGATHRPKGLVAASRLALKIADCPAQPVALFENVDVFAGDTAVANQKRRGGQSRIL